jgi:tetratricopeptide (TPR) repeat protein
MLTAEPVMTRGPTVLGNHIPSYPLTSVMPVKTFVQREALRNSIREQFERSLGAYRERETKKVGIYGLGGVGKSQLALSYLQRYRNDYDATFWIQAGQTTSIDQDFLNIFQLLSNDAENQNQSSADKVLLAVHKWFNGRRGKWLFVFDGADELENSDDVHFVDIHRYIPGSHAHVILTSRSLAARDFSTFEGVEICELEEAQAIELFVRCSQIANIPQEKEEHIRIIVKELGYLALAITLAGSYVSQKPRLSSHLPYFLEEFHQERKRLLRIKPTKIIHQYQHSMITAWEISYSAVRRQLPAACWFLTLLAFLNYEDIFLGIFYLDPLSILTLSQQWSSAINESEVNIQLLEDSFAVLERYSLLQRRGDGSDYTMHRLVHAWGYDRLGENWQDIRHFCVTASRLLEGSLTRMQTSENTPQTKLRLVPHLKENFDKIIWLIKTMEGDEIELLNRVERFSFFLYDIGRWEESATMEKEVLQRRRRILGEENPDTISAVNNLATTLQSLGKLDEAAAMHEKVLEMRSRILGDEHPDTISATSNLAAILHSLGKVDEAAILRNEVFRKRQGMLGDEHPKTMLAMNNLAVTLRSKGKFDDAAAIQRDVLEKRRRILGDDHLSTIGAISNLAITLEDLGKFDEVAAMKREVVEKRQRILGDEHPDTITAVSNLAHTLTALGKLEEAATIQREVLEKRQRILGDEHPDTISAINNLAITLGNQNKFDEAAAIQREALKKTQRILGDEHPDAMMAMSNLANILFLQSELDEAAAIQREVIERRRRIAGDEHPDTIWAMSNLAITLGKLSKFGEAAAIQRAVLKKTQRILGDEHPNTILAMNNLAVTLGDLGKVDEASVMIREVLEQTQRVLGDEHPNTMLAMNNFALSLRGLGNLDEAATIQRAVLKRTQRILGDDHPNTIMAMNNLASTVYSLGRFDEAAVMQREVFDKRKRILGDEHPSTISVRNNLAITLGNLGKVDEAAAMFRENIVSIGARDGEKNHCEICGKPARLCTNCRRAAYCGKGHQRQDWKNHKRVCKGKGM